MGCDERKSIGSVSSMRGVLAPVAAVAMSAAVASAAPYAWVPVATGTYNWNDTTSPTNNWGQNAVFPNSAGDAITISNAATGNQTINLNTPITIGTLTFGISNGSGSVTTGYTLNNGTSGTLTFNNNGSASQLTTPSTAGDNSINATILLANDLNISHNKNYSSAYLKLKGSISSASAGLKTITTNGTGSTGLELRNITDGAGQVALSQTSTTAPLSLTGTNTYTGGTSIATNATINVGNTNSQVNVVGTLAGNVTNNGTLAFLNSSGVFGGVISGTGKVTIGGSNNSNFTLTAGNSFAGGVTLGSTNAGLGALTASDSTNYLASGYTQSILGNGTLSATSTSAGTYFGTLNLRANGASGTTLTFGNSTQTTATPLSIGASTSNVNMSFTADVNRQGGSGTNVKLALGAVTLFATNTFNVTGSNGYALQVTGITLSDVTNNTNANVFTLNPTTAPLIVTGNVTTATAAAGTTGAQTLTLSGSATGNQIQGVINNSSGTGNPATALSVTGGEWTLSNANLYAGGTTVSGGTLLVTNTTGSGTGSAAVNVNAGTLGGNGIITQAVNVTGTIAPGLSIGPLATGELTFNSGTFAAELNSQSATADRLNVTGNLNINGTSTLSLSDIANTSTPMAPNTVLTLVDYSLAWNNVAFSGYADDSTFTLGANQFLINYNDGTALTLTVVPEPATLSVLGLVALVGLKRRRG